MNDHSFTIIYPLEQAQADKAEADRLRAEAEAQQAEYDAAMEAEARKQYEESRKEYYEEHGAEQPVTQGERKRGWDVVKPKAPKGLETFRSNNQWYLRRTIRLRNPDGSNQTYKNGKGRTEYRRRREYVGAVRPRR